MLYSFQDADQDLNSWDITIQDIIASITLQDVQFFLESLGVEQIVMYEDKNYLICPTICHNPLEEAESMKLYWYQNNKIFKCYTECNEAMSIFTLYQKFMAINYHEVKFYEAVDYVKKCLKHIVKTNIRSVRPEINLERYKFNAQVPILPAYPKGMLTYFSNIHHPSWLQDGIHDDVMEQFHIGFSLSQNKITIPHLDKDGRLVGIRGRALDKDEIEEYGKYRPIQIGNVLYTHPLQFNLYGIYEHQQGISRRKSAIIVEGEKSVLLDHGYYGTLSNTVACCGSKFNKYQISLLTNWLGANEITIAFDKEYTNWHDDKASQYRKKIEDMCKRYSGQATFSYIWDMNNLLHEKDSPFDRGKEVFEELYKRRIKVR